MKPTIDREFKFEIDMTPHVATKPKPKPKKHGGELMTITQVARYLGVDRQTLATWAGIGEFPCFAVRKGKREYYRRREIDAWIDAGMPGRSRWKYKGGAR